MNSVCKYTFLVPSYKRRFLEEALLSIQNQTLVGFKVLVSDDCSPEDLKSVVTPFLADERFSYRRNSENMGHTSLVAHWNKLVDYCDTEFLIMASDDDVYDPNFLEEIDNLTRKYPHVDLFHARVRCINEDGVVFKEDALYKENVSHLDYLEQLDYYLHQECMANNVFRTSALKEAGGFVDFPLAWSSDTATTNLMARNGVANTSCILFSYRMSDINISSVFLEDKSVARKKFQALCMYDEFMLNLFSVLKTDGSLLEKTTYDRIISRHKSRVSGQMSFCACKLSIKEFIQYVCTYRKRGYIDSMFITVKKWLLS